MKVIRLVALFAIVASLSGMGCGSTASSVASLASNPMITSLVSSLGVTADQAIGGAGSLLGLAKGNLGGDQWKKVADAIPGADAIMDSGLKMAGLSGKSKNLAEMSEGFTKAGLNKDQVDKMVPAMTDFMSKSGKTEAADLFKGAIK